MVWKWLDYRKGKPNRKQCYVSEVEPSKRKWIDRGFKRGRGSAGLLTDSNRPKCFWGKIFLFKCSLYGAHKTEEHFVVDS